MIIHAPQIFVDPQEVCVSSRIEFQSAALKGFPDSLWFKLPREFSDSVDGDSANAFIVALLLVAMNRGEDIYVKAPISHRLMSGLLEYQHIFKSWYPNTFKYVKVKAANITDNKIPNRKRHGVASTFSGGVDSFFTLWSHLSCNEEIEYQRITHVLFVQGIDIPLDSTKTYAELLSTYRKILKEYQIEVISLRTNVRDFVSPFLAWGLHAFGSGVISTSHLLPGLYNRFFLSSSYSYSDFVTSGSHPAADHLLSSDDIEVVHDGAGFTRLEKIMAISQWPATYSCLRVCLKLPYGLPNCCRCEKCIRTMIPLDLCGKLKNYTSFPFSLERARIRKVFLRKSIFTFAFQSLSYAKKVKRNDIIFDLYIALARSYILIFFEKAKNLFLRRN